MQHFLVSHFYLAEDAVVRLRIAAFIHSFIEAAELRTIKM